MGVVLFELLTAGELPFTAHNQGALVLRILRGDRAKVPRNSGDRWKDLPL